MQEGKSINVTKAHCGGYIVKEYTGEATSVYVAKSWPHLQTIQAEAFGIAQDTKSEVVSDNRIAVIELLNTQIESLVREKRALQEDLASLKNADPQERQLYQRRPRPKKAAKSRRK